MSCHDNPWDPRCNTLKPEIYLACREDENGEFEDPQVFRTLEDAVEAITDENGDHYGTVHRVPTQVVFNHRRLVFQEA